LKYLGQIAIITGAYFIGEAIQTLLKIPVPGAVIGLILLFLALYTGLIKVEMVEDVCDFLLSHMSFFFIPAGVALMTNFEMLSGNWIPFFAIIIITTILVWLVTFYVVKLLKGENSHE